MIQQAKEVVSDSLGLVDFAIGLVNSVLNLPDGQVRFLGEFKLSILLVNFFSGQYMLGTACPNGKLLN